ncbi:MAG: hypothetical protein LBP86_07735 [Azoarcus sp.]|nr:hypothetical protein [Azoarcus sp.]
MRRGGDTGNQTAPDASVNLQTDGKGNTVNPTIANNVIQQIPQETDVPPEALRGILETVGETELARADTDPQIARRLQAKAGEYLLLEKRLTERP